ncbi:MAG: hypothetical protein ACK4SP_04665 [Sphingomonas parapaucimobilis]
MKTLFSGTAILAAALVAMPASAQLLGGGGGLVGGGALGGVTSGLTGGANGTLSAAGQTGRAATDTATRTRGSVRGDRNVDLRRGRVAASGEAVGGSTLDSATRVGSQSGGANGSASGAVGGGVDARLVGTDAVRDTAGAVGNRARGTVSNLTNRAANAGGSVAGSGSGNASATGGNGSLAGNLALAGSGAAQGGAFPVDTGMVVNDAQGRAIGAVQSVRTNARGAVERVLVKMGDKVANLPAANFSGSGNVLVSAMGQGDLSSAAK